MNLMRPLAFVAFRTENGGMAETGNPERLEIKKYANRRFYDLTHSRHLKLEEIRALIKAGHDMRIVDARDGTDITAQILLRIILEFDASKLDAVPVPALTWLVRTDGQSVTEFATENLRQILKPFSAYLQQFQQQVRAAQGSPTAPAGMAELVKAAAAPFTAALSATIGKDAKSKPAETVAAKGENEDLQELIRELKGNKA